MHFISDGTPSLAAAISYYALFSLPPLLVLLLAILGIVLDPVEVQSRLIHEVRVVLGNGASEQIRELIDLAENSRQGSRLTTIFGVGALLFGATGALTQLQAALDHIWGVTPPPEAGRVRLVLVRRVLSLAMVLVIGFLLAISMVLIAGVSWFVSSVGAHIPDWLAVHTIVAGQAVVSFVVVTLLFAAIFKVLSHARMRERDLWIGAAVTALLFQVGQWLFGAYLARFDPGSIYGAAGSLALVLLWVYYSANVLLLGAEFTQAWAEEFGWGVLPRRESRRRRPETAPAPKPGTARTAAAPNAGWTTSR